jgi:predicted RNase H-like HicB family nuclease
MRKSIVQWYLRQPYPRVVVPEEDGYYSAFILGFDGCFAQGTSVEGAAAALEYAAETWLEAALNNDCRPPPPPTEEQVRRWRREIHRKDGSHEAREESTT